MGTTGTLTINPHLYAQLGFNPLNDLTPIGMAFATDHVLVVNSQVAAQTAQELLALLRARPGQLSYGSGGNGSSTHTVVELFKQVALVDIQHVPYRGSAPAAQDLAAGRLDMLYDAGATAFPLAQGGLARALAVSGPRRSAVMPDVPTIGEAGFPQATFMVWQALLAPRGTPPEVVAALHAALRAVLAEGRLRARLTELGAEGIPASPPEEAAAFVRAEMARWQAVLCAANIQPQ